MLRLRRKLNERIIIGGGDSGVPEIKVVVTWIRGDTAEIGIEAPSDVPVHREGVYNQIKKSGRSMLTRPAMLFSTADINRANK